MYLFRNTILILLAVLGFGSVAFALPYYQQTQGLVPGINDEYYIGTSTPSQLEYRGVFTKDLTVTGTCTGCGAAYSLGTTTPWNVGELTYVVNNATISSVATTSVTCSGGTSCSSFNVLGSSPITISSTATAPGGSAGQVQYNASGVFGGVGTTTLTASGVLTLSQAISVIGASPSVLTLTGGTNGQVLGWLGGLPTWTASSSVAAGTGISVSANGAVTTVSLQTPVSVANGGTGATSFAPTSIIVSNAAGTALVATSSDPLWVSSFNATSTTNKSGLATSTPWARLSINADQTLGAAPAFAIGSSSKTFFVVDNSGVARIGTTVSTAGINGSAAPILDAAGFINVDKFSGYKQDGLLLAYASSSVTANGATIFGFGAGGPTATSGPVTSNFPTAFGNSALSANTTGTSNTALGYQSLQFNTSGGSNTGVGRGSLQANTTGSRNTGAGFSALGLTTTGSFNTSIGYQALNGNSTGSFNVGVGHGAGFSGSNVNYSANVFVGYNTNFGSNAGIASTTEIGYRAGFTNTGAQNIYLGYNAGASLTSGSSNIIIGQSINAPSNSGSNQLDIGNVLYGSGMYGTDSLSASPTPSGMIAVGSTSPFARFGIHANNGDTATTLFAIGSSTATATSTFFLVNNTGFTGVATTSPWARLSVNADATLGTSPSFVIGSSTATNFVINNAGYVGIGSSSPWLNLSVQGRVTMPDLATSVGLQTGIVCWAASGELINDSVACVASAARFKKDVQPLKVGLDEVLKLQPVSFYWKPEYNGSLQSNPNYSGMQYSLIADQVQKIDPRLVSLTTATTTFEGKEYAPGTVEGLADVNHWVALFVQAFHDVEAKFQSLVARMSGLEKRLDRQQAQIDALTGEIESLKKNTNYNK